MRDAVEESKEKERESGRGKKGEHWMMNHPTYIERGVCNFQVPQKTNFPPYYSGSGNLRGEVRNRAVLPFLLYCNLLPVCLSVWITQALLPYCCSLHSNLLFTLDSLPALENIVLLQLLLI